MPKYRSEEEARRLYRHGKRATPLFAIGSLTTLSLIPCSPAALAAFSPAIKLITMIKGAVDITNLLKIRRKS
jgi:hypothetical protein